MIIEKIYAEMEKWTRIRVNAIEGQNVSTAKMLYFEFVTLNT